MQKYILTIVNTLKCKVKKLIIIIKFLLLEVQ